MDEKSKTPPQKNPNMFFFPATNSLAFWQLLGKTESDTGSNGYMKPIDVRAAAEEQAQKNPNQKVIFLGKPLTRANFEDNAGFLSPYLASLKQAITAKHKKVGYLEIPDKKDKTQKEIDEILEQLFFFLGQGHMIGLPHAPTSQEEDGITFTFTNDSSRNIKKFPFEYNAAFKTSLDKLIWFNEENDLATLPASYREAYKLGKKNPLSESLNASIVAIKGKEPKKFDDTQIANITKNVFTDDSDKKKSGDSNSGSKYILETTLLRTQIEVFRETRSEKDKEKEDATAREKIMTIETHKVTVSEKYKEDQDILLKALSAAAELNTDNSDLVFYAPGLSEEERIKLLIDFKKEPKYKKMYVKIIDNLKDLDMYQGIVDEAVKGKAKLPDDKNRLFKNPPPNTGKTKYAGNLLLKVFIESSFNMTFNESLKPEKIEAPETPYFDARVSIGLENQLHLEVQHFNQHEQINNGHQNFSRLVNPLLAELEKAKKQLETGMTASADLKLTNETHTSYINLDKSFFETLKQNPDPGVQYALACYEMFITFGTQQNQSLWQTSLPAKQNEIIEQILKNEHPVIGIEKKGGNTTFCVRPEQFKAVCGATTYMGTFEDNTLRPLMEFFNSRPGSQNKATEKNESNKKWISVSSDGLKEIQEYIKTNTKTLKK